jgi:hypothetical protein
MTARPRRCALGARRLCNGPPRHIGRGDGPRSIRGVLGAHWSHVDLRLGVEYADTDPAIGNTRVVLAFRVDVFDSHR